MISRRGAVALLLEPPVCWYTWPVTSASLPSARALVCAFVAAGVLLCRTPSVAAGGENVEAAREHYKRGVAAYDLGRYPQAIAAFEAAYETKPDAALLFNLAQAHRLNGDLRKAVYFYKTYLRKLPNTPKRDVVEERIEALERQLSAQSQLATPASAALTPQVAAPPPQSASSVSIDAKSEEEKSPLSERWWFWAGIGVAVLGGSVALWATTRPDGPPASDLGTRRVSF